MEFSWQAFRYTLYLTVVLTQRSKLKIQAMYQCDIKQTQGDWIKLAHDSLLKGKKKPPSVVYIRRIKKCTWLELLKSDSVCFCPGLCMSEQDFCLCVLALLLYSQVNLQLCWHLFWVFNIYMIQPDRRLRNVSNFF